MAEGWIKLHRKLSDNKLWFSESFTRGQAWVDLILLANHEYGFFYCRDHKIEIQRGEVGWSQIKLAERWMWSRTKVRKFLNDLEKEHQIIQQNSKSYSKIHINNYDLYQFKDISKTSEKQQENTNKNKEEELRKEQESFLSEVKTFETTYPKEMCIAFYNYWSEPNKSKTKMRKDLEKTWDTKRRLLTWFNRSKQK